MTLNDKVVIDFKIRTFLITVGVLILILSLPLLANGDGTIELDKKEALSIMNLAFIARAAQADSEEATRASREAGRVFQSALAKILKDNGVTLETHSLNLLTGTLDPVEIEAEEIDETTP